MHNHDVEGKIKRQRTKDNLVSEFSASIDERVDRYLEIGHQWIIGNHHFAMASSEIGGHNAQLISLE